MLTNEELNEIIDACKGSCDLCNNVVRSLYVKEIDRTISICIYEFAKAMNMVEEIKNNE